MSLNNQDSDINLGAVDECWVPEGNNHRQLLFRENFSCLFKKEYDLSQSPIFE